jgi:iron complex transport system substrate-binding protein
MSKDDVKRVLLSWSSGKDSADEVDAVACQLPGNSRVVNLEPASLADVFQTIRTIASITGIQNQGDRVLRELKLRMEHVVEQVHRASQNSRPRRVAFLEWIDPLFNSGHWTPEMIEMAGAIDTLGNKGGASETLDWESLLKASPDVVFIGCCGYSVDRTLPDLPILSKHPGWHDLPACRNGQVYVVDGNHYFNRPGPRLVDSLELMAAVLYTDIDLPSGITPAVQVPV